MRVELAPKGAVGLSDPHSALWTTAVATTVALRPVPVEDQPTEYIRCAWANRPYGATADAGVATLRDGGRLYIRLEWQDDAQPNGEFPDAAGVMLGVGDGLATMGSSREPMTMWYWSERRPAPLVLTARGPGVFTRQGSDGLEAEAVLDDGRWSLVLSGPLTAAGTGRLGVAIWNGTNEERAGLAAVSREWLALEVG